MNQRKRNVEPKGKPRVNLIMQDKVYLSMLEELSKEKNPADIARKLGISKMAMSKRIAVLKTHGIIEQALYSTYKIYRVNLPVSMYDTEPPVKENGDLHKFIVNYDIMAYGTIPVKAVPEELRGWTRHRLKMKDCQIIMNTKQVQVQFNAGVPRYYQRKYQWTLEEARNQLIQMAEDRIRQFIYNNKSWNVDFTSRKVGDSESTQRYKEFIGFSGKRSRHYKSVHGDGTVEGKVEDMMSLTEGIRAIKDLPLKVDELITSVNDIVKIFTDRLPKEPKEKQEEYHKGKQDGFNDYIG